LIPEDKDADLELIPLVNLQKKYPEEDEAGLDEGRD